ncbi:unnamed protein product [Zymoseptoria tritici ST99CH_1A5]|uniref:Uncharacterized protein n=3 Tax=Zymoseptoria tritici TaxID=1047171 RepID=A0A1X7RKV3_ZYMT9|nr:unnamed protein product [Zymoseptoria tritici ST99CH_3D7]SMR46596.1 unnamed protein product [Zymoseptoria tritici ST99CH_1E4]SMR47838.1 unnamed protein product [Zymoseptoria tritici ST99CH_3D1]SMY21745.1 unnamed protein product [Zymoseptoria tritici ST99CH_1A5]
MLKRPNKSPSRPTKPSRTIRMSIYLDNLIIRLTSFFSPDKHPPPPLPTATYPTVALHIPQDFSPTTNPIHQNLPHEHTSTWRAAQSSQTTAWQKPPPSGPVPRRLSPDSQRRLIEERRRSRVPHHHLPTSNLTPLETRLLTTLRTLHLPTRPSLFRPILTPHSPTLLISLSSDRPILTALLALVKPLGEKERRTVWDHTFPCLEEGERGERLWFVLNTVLFTKGVRVVGMADEGERVRGPWGMEGGERPNSIDFFTGQVG